eukprot:scpid13478/ scgid20788/ 
MNFFFLSQVAAECARYHCDKHVVKMILEYAQLLYTAHAVNNVDDESWRKRAPLGGYRKTHSQHPTAIWVRTCQGNYSLLAGIAKELCSEFTHRYGKQHKTEVHIDWLKDNLPQFPPPPGHDGRLPNGELPKPRKPVYFSTGPLLPGTTPLPLAMPEDCYLPDACQAYRKMYLLHKRSFATWSKRDVPTWFEEGVAHLPPLPATPKTPPKKQTNTKKTVKRKQKPRKPLKENDDHANNDDDDDGDDDISADYAPSAKRKKMHAHAPSSDVQASQKAASTGGAHIPPTKPKPKARPSSKHPPGRQGKQAALDNKPNKKTPSPAKAVKKEPGATGRENSAVTSSKRGSRASKEGTQPSAYGIKCDPDGTSQTSSVPTREPATKATQPRLQVQIRQDTVERVQVLVVDVPLRRGRSAMGASQASS